MSKLQIGQLIKKAGLMLEKNSPYILTGLGCAGLVSTAIMSGKAAVKAHQILVNESFLNNVDKFSLKEKVKLTWKHFLPPVITGSVSIACIVGAQGVNTKRNAALASLYTLTDQTLKDYREKVVEQIGKNKEQKIRDDISQDAIDSNPVSKSEVIITGKGESLCYDKMTGRYFKSDIETLRRIQNDLNHDLMNDMWVPLNTLYYVIGLPMVNMGDEMGWTIDELIELKFSPMIAENGEPCIVIDYDVTPKHIRL